MTRQRSSVPAPANEIASKVLILDNGAHSIKAGFSTPANEHCHVVPNCIARSQRDKRTYIGPELDDCADFGELQLRRPVEKGYIVNWEGEKAIWERAFLHPAALLQCKPSETTLILTEAPNAPAALQKNADEMVFEEFEFASYYRTMAPSLAAYAASPFPTTAVSESVVPVECLLVVDAGHSHTTVTPLYQGRPLQSACRRLDIGGKFLTNYLKDLISRTFDVHREEWIVSEIKEDVCYVSQSFASDLERVWKGGRYDPREVDTSIVVDYVLPDYDSIKRGYSRPHNPDLSMRNRVSGQIGGPKEHVLTIGNERFVVPELLFTPSDIGMSQEGIVGTIHQSLSALPESMRQAFLANIVVVGGTSKTPGFVRRLEDDLRSSIDEEMLVRLAQAPDPVRHLWNGGARLASHLTTLREMVVTRQEYLEHGDTWVRRKFASKSRG